VVATAGALGPRTLRAADLLGAQALRKPLSSKMVVARVRELLRPRPTLYTVEEEEEGKSAR
jgi:DNA-binding response OmpR family regulator